MGPRDGPPNPPAFGAPRRSRVAPRDRARRWGPEMAPQTPRRSARSGGAVSRLEIARGDGAPRWPAKPPAFGALRRSRVAPRDRARRWGPEMAPPNPPAFGAPRR